MDASDAQILRIQLLRLERRVAVLWAAWSLTMVLVLLFGPRAPGAASQPQVIRTRAIELVDAEGRIRGTLDVVNRRPSLWLYGDDGRRRAGLGVGIGGVSEFMLADREGRSRLSLRAGAEKAAEIRIADAEGRTRLGLWVGYDDAPGIWLLDELARPRIGMKVLSGGIARLWLLEESTGRVLFTAP